jgi:predicted ATP-dependent serine protease
MNTNSAPWTCERCGQVNSRWAAECGRCEARNRRDEHKRAARQLTVPSFFLNVAMFCAIVALVVMNHQQRKLLVTAGNALVGIQDAQLLILNSKPCTESTNVRTY